MKPVHGEDMFRYFPDAGSFARAIETCDRALVIARKLGDPHLVEETTIVRGYARMARDLFIIMDGVSSPISPDDTLRHTLSSAVASLTEACLDVNAALLQWEALFGAGAGGGRFTGTLNLSEDITVLASDTLDSLGVANPMKDYLPALAGTWSADDFDSDGSALLTCGFTPSAGGSWEVYYRHAPGAARIDITRVDLVPEGTVTDITASAVASDIHAGRSDPSAYRNGNVYTLIVPESAVGKRYSVAAVTSCGNPEQTRGLIHVKRVPGTSR